MRIHQIAWCRSRCSIYKFQQSASSLACIVSDELEKVKQKWREIILSFLSFREARFTDSITRRRGHGARTTKSASNRMPNDGKRLISIFYHYLIDAAPIIAPAQNVKQIPFAIRFLWIYSFRCFSRCSCLFSITDNCCKSIIHACYSLRHQLL